MQLNMSTAQDLGNFALPVELGSKHANSTDHTPSTTSKRVLLIENQGNNKRKCYRKPSYNTAFIPSIRILKTDIRRKYLEMITNVKNSHDKLLQTGFYSKFSCPQILSRLQFKEKFERFGSDDFIMSGANNLIKIENFNIFLYPDSIMRFSNYQICQRLYEKGSRIVGKISIEGSFVYLPRDFVKELQTVQEIEEDYDENYFVSRPDRFIVPQEPIRFESEGWMLITLDENHCFERFELLNYKMS